MAGSNFMNMLAGVTLVNLISYSRTGDIPILNPTAGIGDAARKVKRSARRRAHAREMYRNGFDIETPTPFIMQSARHSHVDENDDIPGYNPYR